MLIKLVANHNKRQCSLHIKFPQSLCKEIPRPHHGHIFGPIYRPQNLQMLDRGDGDQDGDNVVTRFTKLYSGHVERHATQCFKCGQPFEEEIGMDQEQMGQANRRGCSICFSVFGIGCCEFSYGEQHTTCEPTKCIDCGLFICDGCHNSGGGFDCEKCQMRYCSLCAPKKEHVPCDGINCGAIFCVDCSDPDWSNGDASLDERYCAAADDRGDIVVCSICQTKLCKVCNGEGNPFPAVVCGVCELQYCRQCAHDNGTLSYNGVTSPKCTECGKQTCSQCSNNRACSHPCTTVLCTFCEAERMVTLPNGTAYCVECTDLMACSSCTLPIMFNPSDEATRTKTCPECNDAMDV